MLPSSQAIARSPFYLVAAVMASLLAFCTAMQIYLGMAVVLGSVWALALALYAPVAILMAWIATGPLLSGWAGAVLGEGVPALTPDRVLVVVLGGVSALRWLARPDRLQKPGAIEWSMAAFIALACFSMVRGGGSPGIAGGIRRDFIFLMLSYGIPFIIFVLARNLLREPRHVLWLLGTMLATDVIAAALGVVQHLGGVTAFQPNRFEFAGNSDRAMGVFSSPIEFGYCMSTGLLIVLVLALRPASTAKRLGLALCALPMAVAIVLAKSRAPWLGVVVGAMIVSVYDRRLRRGIVAAGAAGAVALVAAAAILPQVMDTREFEARVFEISPIYNRIALTATAVNMIVEKPLTGWGFNRFAFYINKSHFISNFGGIPPSFSNPGVPHNEALHVLVLLGVTGFVPFVAVYVLCFRMLVRTLRAIDDANAGAAAPWAGGEGGGEPDAPADLRRELGLIALATMGMYVFNGMAVDIALFQHASNQLFVLLGAAAGMGLADASPARPPEPDDPLPEPSA